MATFNKHHSFVEALAEKVHNLGSDVIMVALCAAASAPIASNSQLSNLTQISYTGLSTRVITIASSSQTSGTYKLVATDLVLTASGAIPTFRYLDIYNDTATNKELICWFDYGTNVDLAIGETFTLDFDGTNGLLQIA